MEKEKEMEMDMDIFMEIKRGMEEVGQNERYSK
jgi:hypothetical protein